MNAPRSLITAALLFWGWENSLLPWAFLMVAAVEASAFVKTRWDFSDTDLYRICDLCIFLFVGAGILLLSTEDRFIVVFKFVQWMPFCFFPLALVHLYGERSSVPLTSFNWLLRHISQGPLSYASLNISYGYFAICVLGASTSTRPDLFFYPGISALILLALAGVRPNRVSQLVWIIMALTVALGARLTQQALRQTQTSMEFALATFLTRLAHPGRSPRELRTFIGATGRVNLSGHIALRVNVPPDNPTPPLIRDAAYDTYSQGTWTAQSNEFFPVPLGSNGTADLLPARPIACNVQIAGYFSDGALVPLPHGTFQITEFDGVLLTNRLGVASMQTGPGLLDYRAQFWKEPSMDAPPGPADLFVPGDEAKVLGREVARLNLDKMSDREKIHTLAREFHDHFLYSLQTQPHLNSAKRRTSLGRFLREVKAGHCEYFATATVMLLRQAGVPARYITGYALLESDRRGRTYLVRERHRHAWALVWRSDSKSWEQVDNTPSKWLETNTATASWWEPVSDFFSNLRYQFALWRWGKTSLPPYAKWALAPLVLFFLWRTLASRRRVQKNAADSASAMPAWPGLDSELYLIERRLADVNLSRNPNEPLNRWQQRLEQSLPSSVSLRPVFDMHRRLRFDPRGLPPGDRETLRLQATHWLAAHQKLAPDPVELK